MRWASLLLLVVAVSCGDSFRAADGGAKDVDVGGSSADGTGSGAGKGETGGSGEPSMCETWCDQLATSACDVTWPDCVAGCEERFDDTCEGDALLACYVANWSGCMIPSACSFAAGEYALCLGITCAGATCDEHGGGVCACDEICTGAVRVSADCTSSDTEIACTCTLTGPLAATDADAASASCQGAKATPAWCTQGWGCCAELFERP